MNNETITITRATAERALARLSDWLEWVEDLDTETRADIVALDELIKELEAEESYSLKIQKDREARQKAQAEFMERKKAEASN
jgi:hypothetical protein